MTGEEMRRRAMMTEKMRLKLWEVEQELAEAKYIIAKGVDSITRQEWQKRIRTEHFKAFRDLASHCVDNQGRVQRDFLEDALFNEDPNRVTMFPRHADGT
jgi:aryl carrier-like protein